MIFPFALPMITDGFGSCDELTGHDPDAVCSENVIENNPRLLLRKKQQAVADGVTALLSPTGGIMHERLEDFGLDDDDFSSLNDNLTELVLSCAGSLPVGGVVHENIRIHEEYGKTVFESAYFDHLERMTALKDAGVSFILLEYFDKLWDMRAAVLAANSIDMPVFVLLRVDDEGKTNSDTDYIAALITLQALGAAAFGIECTDSAEVLAVLLKKALPHAEIPLIAAADFSGYSTEQLSHISEHGASIFIDCSETLDPDKLTFLKSLSVPFDPFSEKDSYAAAGYREAFFLPEDLNLSEPVRFGYDMADELIDLDDSPANAIYCILDSTDDAASIADNADMSYLPFVVHTDDPTTLEAALRYYQGRLIVDSRCDIDRSTLLSLSQKYGAILY